MESHPYDYWKAKKPNYWRRAPWHDYASRCIYMITMLKAPEVEPFSSIIANPKPSAKLTLSGLRINNEIHNFPLSLPWLEFYDYVVMPDHVHLIVFIKEKGHQLGDVINRLKILCTKALGQRAFLPGYHDRIYLKAGQLDVMRAYVRDNPRRLYVKTSNPHYFKARHALEIDGKRYEAIGNIALLTHPCKQAVKVSSKVSEAENQRLREQWLFNAGKGGVLVSPFVAPAEREVRDKAMALGAGIILIMENGFPERYKPSGPYFDAFSEGRVLVIGESEYHTEGIKHFRAKALEMNATAEKVAAGEVKVLTHSSPLAR